MKKTRKSLMTPWYVKNRRGIVGGPNLFIKLIIVRGELRSGRSGCIRGQTIYFRARSFDASRIEVFPSRRSTSQLPLHTSLRTVGSGWGLSRRCISSTVAWPPPQHIVHQPVHPPSSRVSRPVLSIPCSITRNLTKRLIVKGQRVFSLWVVDFAALLEEDTRELVISKLLKCMLWAVTDVDSYLKMRIWLVDSGNEGWDWMTHPSISLITLGVLKQAHTYISDHKLSSASQKPLLALIYFGVWLQRAFCSRGLFQTAK